MKTTVKALKMKTNETREELVSSVMPNEDVFVDKKEEKLVEELFSDISNATELESHIWNTVDGFTNNYISVEDIFSARKDASLADTISEILSERDNTLDGSSVSDIDNVLESAGFRYMLMIASNVEQELLQVYLLDNLSSVLSDLDENLELDASEYGDYDDEESLLDEFMDELISPISGDEKIIQIEDNHKDALVDFFNLEV